MWLLERGKPGAAGADRRATEDDRPRRSPDGLADGAALGHRGDVRLRPSGVTMACRVSDCNAGHAVTASARGVVPVIGVTSARSFYLGAGVGLVALGGTAYEGVAGTTSISPTVGAGLELKLASARSVRIEAEDYWFRPPFRSESCDASWGVCRVLPPFTGWTQRFQHTLILSVGWVFRGGGPRR